MNNLPTGALLLPLHAGHHAHAISLHFMHYDFCRLHQTLTKTADKRTTPAMAAGIATYPWSLTQPAELLD